MRSIRMTTTGDLAEHSAQERELDLSEALARLDGDSILLAELARIFLTEAPKLLRSLETAIHERDFREMETSAHSLKGGISNFAAKQAYQYAFALERKGRAHDIAGADELFSSLELNFQRVARE